MATKKNVLGQSILLDGQSTVGGFRDQFKPARKEEKKQSKFADVLPFLTIEITPDGRAIHHAPPGSTIEGTEAILKKRIELLVHQIEVFQLWLASDGKEHSIRR